MGALVGGENRALRSISLHEINNEETCHLLQLLENNNTIERVQIKWDLRETYHHLSEATVFQLRRTLKTNRSIKKLCLYHHPKALPVLVEVMENNCGSLEHICLEQVTMNCSGNADFTHLLRSLRNNTPLRGMTLQYTNHRRLIPHESWKLLMEAIRYNSHLKVLNLCFSALGDASSVNIDELGDALTHNFNLTTVKIRHNGRTQPQLDFISRLFCRRNLIMQGTQQKEFPTTLWPKVLESLSPSPSELFLAMKYFLCHTGCSDNSQKGLVP